MIIDVKKWITDNSFLLLLKLIEMEDKVFTIDEFLKMCGTPTRPPKNLRIPWHLGWKSLVK